MFGNVVKAVGSAVAAAPKPALAPPPASTAKSSSFGRLASGIGNAISTAKSAASAQPQPEPAPAVAPKSAFGRIASDVSNAISTASAQPQPASVKTPSNLQQPLDIRGDVARFASGNVQDKLSAAAGIGKKLGSPNTLSDAATAANNAINAASAPRSGTVSAQPTGSFGGFMGRLSDSIRTGIADATAAEPSSPAADTSSRPTASPSLPTMGEQPSDMMPPPGGPVTPVSAQPSPGQDNPAGGAPGTPDSTGTEPGAGLPPPPGAAPERASMSAQDALAATGANYDVSAVNYDQPAEGQDWRSDYDRALSSQEQATQAQLGQTWSDQALASRRAAEMNAQMGRGAGGGLAGLEAQVALGGMQQRANVLGQAGEKRAALETERAKTTFAGQQAADERRLKEWQTTTQDQQFKFQQLMDAAQKEGDRDLAEYAQKMSVYNDSLDRLHKTGENTKDRALTTQVENLHAALTKMQEDYANARQSKDIEKEKALRKSIDDHAVLITMLENSGTLTPEILSQYGLDNTGKPTGTGTPNTAQTAPAASTSPYGPPQLGMTQAQWDDLQRRIEEQRAKGNGDD
jgi:hypothetical protein